MKSFRQYQEDSGGAGGAPVVVAASTGSVTGGQVVATGNVSGAGDNPDKTVPVSKKKQKEYVSAVKEQNSHPDSDQQRLKSSFRTPEEQIRRNMGLVRRDPLPAHKLDDKASQLKPYGSQSAVKAPGSGVPNRVGPQNPSIQQRRITGAVNMESFAEFHKKSKIKPGTGVGPLAFMTKEEADVNEGTVAHQKLTTAQNATTSKNPTGFVKVGDTGHLGFGTKGGAGFTGTVSKIEGDMVHMTSKYNKDKTYRGHVSKFTKD